MFNDKVLNRFNFIGPAHFHREAIFQKKILSHSRRFFSLHNYNLIYRPAKSISFEAKNLPFKKNIFLPN